MSHPKGPFKFEAAIFITKTKGVFYTKSVYPQLTLVLLGPWIQLTLGLLGP